MTGVLASLASDGWLAYNAWSASDGWLPNDGWSAYDGWLAVNPNNVRPGYGALLLVLGLAVVTYLLWRSMNTQLGKIQMPPRQPPSESGRGSEQARDAEESARGAEAAHGADAARSADADEGDDDAERPPAPPSN